MEKSLSKAEITCLLSTYPVFLLYRLPCLCGAKTSTAILCPNTYSSELWLLSFRLQFLCIGVAGVDKSNSMYDFVHK